VIRGSDRLSANREMISEQFDFLLVLFSGSTPSPSCALPPHCPVKWPLIPLGTSQFSRFVRSGVNCFPGLGGDGFTGVDWAATWFRAGGFGGSCFGFSCSVSFVTSPWTASSSSFTFGLPAAIASRTSRRADLCADSTRITYFCRLLVVSRTSLTVCSSYVTRSSTLCRCSLCVRSMFTTGSLSPETLFRSLLSSDLQSPLSFQSPAVAALSRRRDAPAAAGRSPVHASRLHNPATRDDGKSKTPEHRPRRRSTCSRRVSPRRPSPAQ
jgi:hypothetical protein